MADVTFDIVDEQISSLESIGVEEGCTTSSSSSSLDISDVDFE
ncbi:hypothetical protein [Streptomyces niveus]